MRKRTGLEGRDDFLSDRIIDGFQIRHWVILLVRSLRKKGYITGILSDQTHWLYELDSYDHFFKEFDCIYNSYELGKGKVDATIFTDVVKDMELLPEEVLFIDDDEENVKRARKMGLKSFLYVDHRTFIPEISSVLKEEFEQ
jgi:putative hydrolase of the HAD superfamily